MGSELQVDVDALNSFAKRMNEFASGYAKYSVTPPPATVQFGQSQVDDFPDAHTLAVQYQVKAGELTSDFQTFLAELQQLATAATELAKNYQAAAAVDAVSAQDVDNALGTPKTS